jgi:amidase
LDAAGANGHAGRREAQLDIDGLIVGGWDLMAHCRAVTLTGAPSVSVPIGRSVEGLALSVQVVASPWKDELALHVAQLVESQARTAG